MPIGLIVADFFVLAWEPSAELCLEDTVANRKGKRKKGGPKEGGNATSPLHSRGSPGGMFARRAPGALLLDYVPPEEPPSTPLGNALRIR